jgi:hypothetical protein
MIKDYREITMDMFLEKILPHTAIMSDRLLIDFRRAVEEQRPYMLIFRDYEITVPLAEVEAYLEKTGGGALPGVAVETIDAFLPKVEGPRPETPAEVEARAVAAKHPKPKAEFPSFKPVKKAPPAPDLGDPLE